MPRADVYYLAEGSALFERNALIRDSGLPEYDILLKRAGGWRTGSYNEFYINDGRQTAPLPSFHFEGLMDAIFKDRIDELPPDERLLALCLEFWCGCADDIQEVLASQHLAGMMGALREIGAARFAGLLEGIISESFSGVGLPLNDDQIEQMGDRLRRADRSIRNEEPAWEELLRGMSKLIAGRLSSGEYVY